MFIQVISGTARDADALARQFDKWVTDLQPGSIGFLGATSGFTDDGRFLTAARFESAEAAQRNSARPEQGAWWSETEQYASNVVFNDCTRVETLFGGGNDDAKFVQVMRGRIKDPAKAEAMFGRSAEAEATLHDARPDVIGEVIAVHDDGQGFTDIVYFTSEADARSGEAKEMDDAAKAMMAEFDAALEVTDYFDLTRLWLH
jgi:hypothetical protein